MQSGTAAEVLRTDVSASSYLMLIDNMLGGVPSHGQIVPPLSFCWLERTSATN